MKKLAGPIARLKAVTFPLLVATVVALALLSCGEGGEGGGEGGAPTVPRFEDYAEGVETFSGAPAPVDLTSHKDARSFRTRLTNGAKSGPNFAGSYTVIEWGCGSGCQSYAVVDARTGAVHFPDFTTSMGAGYNVKSRLFIANDPAYVTPSDPEYMQPRYYFWDGSGFEFIYPLDKSGG